MHSCRSDNASVLIGTTSSSDCILRKTFRDYAPSMMLSECYNGETFQVYSKAFCVCKEHQDDDEWSVVTRKVRRTSPKTPCIKAIKDTLREESFSNDLPCLDSKQCNRERYIRHRRRRMKYVVYTTAREKFSLISVGPDSFNTTKASIPLKRVRNVYVDGRSLAKKLGRTTMTVSLCKLFISANIDFTDKKITADDIFKKMVQEGFCKRSLENSQYKRNLREGPPTLPHRFPITQQRIHEPNFILAAAYRRSTYQLPNPESKYWKPMRFQKGETLYPTTPPSLRQLAARAIPKAILEKQRLDSEEQYRARVIYAQLDEANIKHAVRIVFFTGVKDQGIGELIYSTLALERSRVYFDDPSLLASALILRLKNINSSRLDRIKFFISSLTINGNCFECGGMPTRARTCCSCVLIYTLRELYCASKIQVQLDLSDFEALTPSQTKILEDALEVKASTIFERK